MRSAVAWSLSALLAWATAAAGGQPGEATDRPQFSTRVEGTVPNLTGRWLVITQVRTSQAPSGGNGSAQLWEISNAGDGPQLVVRDVQLPPALQAALASANEAGRDWEPNEAQLRELRDGWAALPSYDRGVASTETVITGRDAFTDAIRSDDQMKGSDFVIQTLVNFAAGPNRPIKDVLLFGVNAEAPFGYSANSVSATIAPTPIPIPIVLKGVARLYRLESVPARGVLGWIADAFTGCGRRQVFGEAIPRSPAG